MSTGLLSQLEAYFSDVDTDQGPVSPDHVAELIDHVREVQAPVPAKRTSQVWIAAAAFVIVIVLVGGLVLLSPFGGDGVAPSDQPASTVPPTTATDATDDQLRARIEDSTIRYTGAVASAGTPPTDGEVIQPDEVTVATDTQGSAVISWANYYESLGGGYQPGRSTQAAASPTGVFALPDGGFVASPALGPEPVWYSEDGQSWVVWDAADLFYAGNPNIQWIDGDWACTWEQEANRDHYQLWHHREGSWFEVDVQATRPCNRPVVSEDLTLIANSGFTNDTLLLADSSGTITQSESPWTVPPQYADGHHNLDVVAVPNGGFAVYLVNDDPSMGYWGGWLDLPVKVWTTTNGLDWTYGGELEFVPEGSAWIQFETMDGTVRAVSEAPGTAASPGTRSNEEGASGSHVNGHWTSIDGVNWSEAPNIVAPYSALGQPPFYDPALGWIHAGDAWEILANGTDGWTEIPPPPDRRRPWGGFRIQGSASGILYRSSGDGLWIGTFGG